MEDIEMRWKAVKRNGRLVKEKGNKWKWKTATENRKE